jgi:hypothetical protein
LDCVPAYLTKSSDFIDVFYTSPVLMAKEYSGFSCFYKVDDDYFNVFNRDRLVMIIFLIFFILLKKFWVEVLMVLIINMMIHVLLLLSSK